MNIPSLKEAQKRNKETVKVIHNEYLLSDELKQIGHNKKYYLRTYGCQMNVHDSEAISAMLEDMSYTKTDNYEEADLILLNTCAIRENVHNKVFGMLGRIKHLKETKSNIIVGICGCMTQEEIVVDKILNKYKWLDFVFGTHNIHKLPEVLNNSLIKNKLEIDVWSKEGDIIENIPIKRENKYKAWVNIMYGCDKFCTYCIVPYTRGKERSRRPSDIIDEVNKLIKEGYLEITLLGQNVNAYGKDFTDIDYKMEDLLNDVSKTNIKRINFMTSHPWDFTDKMIEVMKNNSNIMRYLHLPVQSGSNKILKLMGRRYTKENYLTLFNKIKKAIPDIAITTDIIVGFPGETEEDFKETIDIVNACKFDIAYTFIYSPRVGTPAAKMFDNISLDIKNKRLAVLNNLINNYSFETNKSYINKILPILIEGYSDKDKNTLMGYTNTSKLVNIKGSSSYIGRIVNVKITDAKTWSLNGEIADEKS
ncbi:MAG: tRNA (N6-isopentenyl adenosine(37)-C2)-methylthiotransferase MiaB [Bacilli bacterium]|nr:tRNA (N6-isopentenyl adenosine(37)-C2)-methylthiotransferase MiaB [Bacilli bacterium]